MKLTPTVAVDIGVLICAAGALFLAKFTLTPDAIALTRNLVLVTIGGVCTHIAYAQTICETIVRGKEKGPLPPEKPE